MFDSLLNNLTIRGAAGMDSSSLTPPKTEDEEPMAPSPRPVLPQSLLAGHEPSPPLRRELTVTELIGAEPTTRDSEGMLEEMEIEAQRLSVG